MYSSSSAVAAGVSLRVVAKCGARHPAMATMHVRGRKVEYTQQRYMNRLIRLKFSTIHVMASRVVYRLSVACVSHELHARNFLDE